MKKFLGLLIVMMMSLPSIAQTYTASTGQQCGAYTNREGTFVDAPYITENITLTMDWLYCGPWSGNNNGHIYVDIWINDSWQDLFDLIDSGNGCSWVTDLWTISPSTWNSAVDSNGGDVLIRAYITDVCSPGVGCSFYNDPCFNGNVGFDYEPLESAISSFDVNSATICVGETLTINDLSSGSALDYSWDFGIDASPDSSISSGSQEITYSTPGTKTISLTVTNLIGDSTYELEVEVNPIPEITTSNDDEICIGSNTNIEVFGIGDVLWSDDLGTEYIAEVEPITNTTYYVSLTNIFSCVSTDSVSIVVNDLPIVDAGDDVNICVGETVMLTAQGEGILEWDNDLGTVLQPEVSPELTTTYMLTATDLNDCVNTTEVVVAVFDYPIAYAGEDVEICNGESYELEASGGSIYDWDNGLGEGSIQEVSPAETSTYIVVVSNDAECMSVDSVSIVVNELPVANAGEDVEICAGLDFELMAAGGGTYFWDNELGEGQSHTVQPNESTTYEVTVGNEFNCFDTDDIYVAIMPIPEVLAGDDVEICYGESTVLVGSGEGTLVWSNDSEAELEQLVMPEITTTYTLYSEGLNGCLNEDEVTVEVNDLPIANAGEDVDICLGESTNVEATGGLYYSWNNDLGEGSIHEVTPLETTVYIVSVGSEDFCYVSDSIQVSVHAYPSIFVTEGGEICPGESMVISVTGEGNFQWNNGLGSETSYEVSPEETTTYIVTSTNEYSCESSAELTVVVHPDVEVSLSGLSEDPYCSADQNAYNMIGTPSGGEFSGNGVDGNQFIPSDAGIGALEITYTYTDEFSCPYAATILAEVEICPSVFEEEIHFDLFPNPIQNELLITSEGLNKKIEKIVIYSITGKLVLEQNISDQSMPIVLNCSHLSSGNYILQMIGVDWNVRYSVVKE